MCPLAELVASSIDEWDGRLEQALLGTSEPYLVAQQLEDFVAAVFSEPTGAVLYRTGVGIVAGLALVDGSAVVLKLHRWNVSLERLSAVQEVQLHLARQGLPAPMPLARPAPLGQGIATVEQHLPGECANGPKPAVRRAVADMLHRFVVAATPLGDVDVGAPLLLRPHGAPLWDEPHSIRFDFDATASGAEWIDEAAREARKRLDADSGPPVIGHFDWRVGNLGFSGSRITAIYDWDSVARASEAVIVGANAAQFCTDWASDADDPLPTVQEMIAFVVDYEQARGTPFTQQERQQLDAANLALDRLRGAVPALRQPAPSRAGANELWTVVPPAPRARRPPARHSVLTGARGISWRRVGSPRATVRERMPSVARSAPSDRMGKMSAFAQSGWMSDQS